MDGWMITLFWGEVWLGLVKAALCEVFGTGKAALGEEGMER
jgi:hypothetical protein